MPDVCTFLYCIRLGQSLNEGDRSDGFASLYKSTQAQMCAANFDFTCIIAAPASLD